MVVAPGFVDIHSHSDFTLLVDPRAQSQIYQGVTTELVGNCGHGCGPFVGDIERFKGNIYGYQDLLKIDWGSLGDYLDLLDELRPALRCGSSHPPQPSGVWRFQATRPDGSVIITSLPYRDATEARAALAFVGVLHLFAGDTTRTGQVRGATQPSDQICDCQTLGTDCRHHEVELPDRRGPDPEYRGPSLGLSTPGP